MDKYAEIRNRFEENADQENAVKMAKYMEKSFLFLRIPTPNERSFTGIS